MPKDAPRLDFANVQTYPLATRRHKVNAAAFADLDAWRRSGKLRELFPAILKGSEIIDLTAAWRGARERGKPVIVGLGAHVIKCGLSPILVDLIERDLITAVALNGAGIVHDFEVAMVGATSEEVEEEIGAGRFGMAEETAAGINAAIAGAVAAQSGLGEAIGRYIVDTKLPHKSLSILAACVEHQRPCTVHVAIGTDIIHMHPATDGARIGEMSLTDFRRFTEQVALLDGGGLYCNFGSAVILPEIFIKALSLARNLGVQVREPLTANFDMLRHYRPEVNVLQRPTMHGGRSFNFTGHHELMLPLLYTLLVEESS